MRRFGVARNELGNRPFSTIVPPTGTRAGAVLERLYAPSQPSLVPVGHNDDFKIRGGGIHRRARPGIPPGGSDLHGQTGVNAAEAELTMRLASIAPVREAARPRLVELLQQVDPRAYGALLAERGLLSLLGSRAIGLAPEAVDDAVRAHVESERREARLRALTLDTTLRRVVKALEEAGVATLPIKGTTLADRVHGDPGLRPTTDVDVLVSRARIRSAVEALCALGYPAPDDPVWTGGLPEMHYTFGHGDAAAPRVELHWRVHPSERSFSEELLRAATEAPDGLRRADPAHEFALLLVIYARDGLYGPRLVADIAEWWDRFGDQVAPGALDGVVARNPALRRSIVAALECLRRFVGVHASRVLTYAAADRSTRRAVALADPFIADEDADVFATVMLIDALLSMGRQKMGFLRRYYVQPLPFVRSTYGLRDAPTALVACRNALHAAGTVVKASPRMIRAARRSPARPMLLDEFPTGRSGDSASGRCWGEADPWRRGRSSVKRRSGS
jgi:hypothetical protein